MAWTEDIYPHFSPYDPHAFQILPAPQQPPTILQQLPATVMPPGSAASIRPGGHVKEDLVELMMIQNAQMHQVIMNNMTMSALSSFGFSGPPSGHAAPRDLLIIQEEAADQAIYHHYYQPGPYVSCPAWLQCQTTQVYQDPNNPTSSPPSTDRPTVPPPPPPPPPPPLSTTEPVGADVTPAAGKSDHTAAPSQQPISTACSRDAKGTS